MMRDDRTTEVAEFEADLRRTRGEMLDDGTDLGEIVRQRVHRYWEERHAFTRVVAMTKGGVAASAEDAAQFAVDVQRTRQELAETSVDLERIAAEGASAYWSRRHGTAATPAPALAADASGATAALLRSTLASFAPSFDTPAPAMASAAALPMSRAVRLLSVGFVAVAVPLVVLSVILLRTTDVAPLFRIAGLPYVLRQHTQFAPVSAAILFAVFAATVLLFRKPHLRRWSVAMGSVAASALLAIYGIAYVDASGDVQAFEERGGRALVLSLDRSALISAPGGTRVKAAGLSEHSVRLSPARAGLRGELVGRVSSPTEANLEWHVDDEVFRRARFVVGKVQRIENGQVLILTENETFLVPAQTTGTYDMAVGQEVIAQFDGTGKFKWWYPTTSADLREKTSLGVTVVPGAAAHRVLGASAPPSPTHAVRP